MVPPRQPLVLLRPNRCECVCGGGGKQDLSFTPHIQTHLHFSQAKSSCLQLLRVPCSAGAGVSLWPIFIPLPHIPHLVSHPSPSLPSQRSALPNLKSRKQLEPNSRVTWPERPALRSGEPWGRPSTPIPTVERAGLLLSHVVGQAWAFSPAFQELGQPPVSGP